MGGMPPLRAGCLTLRVLLLAHQGWRRGQVAAEAPLAQTLGPMLALPVTASPGQRAQAGLS